MTSHMADAVAMENWARPMDLHIDLHSPHMAPVPELLVSPGAAATAAGFNANLASPATPMHGVPSMVHSSSSMSLSSASQAPSEFSLRACAESAQRAQCGRAEAGHCGLVLRCGEGYSGEMPGLRFFMDRDEYPVVSRYYSGMPDGFGRARTLGLDAIAPDTIPEGFSQTQLPGMMGRTERGKKRWSKVKVVFGVLGLGKLRKLGKSGGSDSGEDDGVHDGHSDCFTGSACASAQEPSSPFAIDADTVAAAAAAAEAASAAAAAAAAAAASAAASTETCPQGLWPAEYPRPPFFGGYPGPGMHLQHPAVRRLVEAPGGSGAQQPLMDSPGTGAFQSPAQSFCGTPRVLVEWWRQLSSDLEEQSMGSEWDNSSRPDSELWGQRYAAGAMGRPGRQTEKMPDMVSVGGNWLCTPLESTHGHNECSWETASV